MPTASGTWEGAAARVRGGGGAQDWGGWSATHRARLRRPRVHRREDVRRAVHYDAGETGEDDHLIEQMVVAINKHAGGFPERGCVEPALFGGRIPAATDPRLVQLDFVAGLHVDAHARVVHAEDVWPCVDADDGGEAHAARRDLRAIEQQVLKVDVLIARVTPIDAIRACDANLDEEAVGRERRARAQRAVRNRAVRVVRRDEQRRADEVVAALQVHQRATEVDRAALVRVARRVAREQRRRRRGEGGGRVAQAGRVGAVVRREDDERGRCARQRVARRGPGRERGAVAAARRGARAARRRRGESRCAVAHVVRNGGGGGGQKPASEKRKSSPAAKSHLLFNR